MIMSTIDDSTEKKTITTMIAGNEVKSYLDGLMYFVKMFKNANKRFLAQWGNRLVSVTDGALYDDKVFLGELDISFNPWYCGKWDKSVLHKYCNVILNDNMLLNNPLARMCIDVEEFYNFYQELTKQKQILQCNKIVFTGNPIDEITGSLYPMYYSMDIFDPVGNLMYSTERTKYLSYNPKYPITINGKMIPDSNMHMGKVIGRTCAASDDAQTLVELLKNRETPLDVSIQYDRYQGLILDIGNGIVKTHMPECDPIDPNCVGIFQKPKTFSISKNVFPKEMLSDNTRFIAFTIERCNDNILCDSALMINIYTILDNMIFISSKFKTLIL